MIFPNQKKHFLKQFYILLKFYFLNFHYFFLKDINIYFRISYIIFNNLSMFIQIYIFIL